MNAIKSQNFSSFKGGLRKLSLQALLYKGLN